MYYHNILHMDVYHIYMYLIVILVDSIVSDEILTTFRTFFNYISDFDVGHAGPAKVRQQRICI